MTCNIEVDATFSDPRAEQQNKANPTDVIVGAVLSADARRP
jgi:hypothetical protein